ncbi:MAG TPA: PAS domain S-box protein [Verrucomicrobiae bacterium]|nr:PAS domain S-box protein [Verrucomicrobiae bacterium]
MERVLVIEGDGLLRGRIVSALRTAGMGAEVCSGLEEAASLCSAGGVGAVVLDVGVAGAGLRAFCERVREAVSIVAMVDDVSGTKGEAVLSMGADDFVAWPVDPDALALRVRLRMGMRRDAEGEALLRRMLDVARDMVVAVDGSRRIIGFNAPAAAGFGWTRDEVFGHCMDELFAEPGEGVRIYELVRQKGSCGGEVTNQRKDGKWFVSEVGGAPLEGGGAALVFREITRQRAAERALRESELRYRAMVDDQTEMVSRSDVLGRITFVNRAFSRKFGVDAGSVVGADILDFVYPDDRKLVKANLAKLGPGNLVVVCEHRIVSPAGAVAWVLRTDHGILGGEGVLSEVQSACRDITEQRMSRATLLESEARYRLLFDANPSACLVFDGKTGGFLVVNDGAVVRYGYSRAELLKMRIEDLHLEEDRPALQQFILGLGGGLTRAGVWRQRKKDGSIIYAETVCHPFRVGERTGYLLVAHDITELKLAEERLRMSQDRYRRLLENTKAVPWEADVATHRFLYVGPQAAKLLMYPPDDWLVEGFWKDRLHPEMRERVIQNRRSAIASAGEFDEEYRLVARDGSTVWVRHVESLGTDARGERVLRGFMVDISDRRLVEQKFHAVARAVESTSDPVCITDAKGAITHRNPAFNMAFGEACTSLDGDGGLESRFVERGAMEGAKEAFHIGGSWAGQVTMHVAGGRRSYMLLRVDSIARGTDRPAGSVWVFTDLAGRQTLDAEMIRSSKLESIGLLAGGIAHDFNNLLLIISGNISLAKMESPEDAPTVALLSEAEKASERAAELAKQLLTFAKGGAPRRRPVRLARLLEETVKFNLHGSKSVGEVACADDLWPVMIDEGQIVQALSNLIINAKEAMPQGGTIRVRARNQKLADGEIASLEGGEYVYVRVSDEGVGISAEVMDKIFDPYFTTKSHGSGLGLLTAYSIIRKHEGLIMVESEPGVGTTFDIYLPAEARAVVREETTPKGALVSTSFLLREGKGKIMVMDDEPGVRLTMIKALRRLGYDGHPARNAEEAMAAFQEARDSGQPFDAAILDLTIPRGPGGEDVVKMMREVAPDFPAIAFSGYSENPVLANYREYGFAAAMAKPFHIEELARKLGHVLRRRGGR